MKKKLLLALLPVLLLLGALSGAASAETFVTLGSFPAGEELDIRLAETGLDPAAIVCEDLPEGLRLECADFGGSSILTLRGAPRTAGEQHFTIVAEDLIVCSMSVTPAVPRVAMPANLRCGVGEAVELRVTASVPDDGVLSYQWYLSRGPFSEAIEGANSDSYRPDTSEEGSAWYCCEVTNTNNGLSVSTMSDYTAVEVGGRQILSVTIESLPYKTDYLVGEELDVKGLRILVRYEGGYNEILDEGFTVSPEVFRTAGTHSVTVSYSGYSCGFNVMVQNEEDTVTGIGVLTLPRKTEYAPGDNLETEGLSIRARTQDGGYFDVSSGLDCSPTRFDQEGTQIVTVRYADKTCTFTVTVKDDKVPTGISILTMPSMRTYTVGDRLDASGLTIMLNSNKGSEIISEGFVVTPKVLTTAGTQEITVLYGQFKTSFRVTVKEREGVISSPSPSPAAAPGGTPAPESSPGQTGTQPEATASPLPTAPTRKNTGVNTGVKIIFAIAVLALAGLAGYVWYLRKQGFGEEEAPGDAGESTPTVSGEPVEEDKTPKE